MDVIETAASSPGSRVSVVSRNDLDVETMAPAPSTIERPDDASVWINKPGKVHIDKITNNIIQREPAAKGCFGARRCRCTSLMLVCMVSVFGCAACVIGLHYLIPRPRLLNLGLKESWYLRRDDWRALPAVSIHYLTLPLRQVIVGQSATPACHSREDCIQKVLAIQHDHLHRRYRDISPNFLVSAGGLVFEGRGANVRGAMLKNYERKAISIMFVGDYRKEVLDEEQIKHFKVLLEVLVYDGVLAVDYKIKGKCQILASTYSPGMKVMEVLHKIPSWNPVNATLCLDNGNDTSKVLV